jgi:hypothetical protein
LPNRMCALNRYTLFFYRRFITRTCRETA